MKRTTKDKTRTRILESKNVISCKLKAIQVGKIVVFIPLEDISERGFLDNDFCIAYRVGSFNDSAVEAEKCQ